MTRFSIDKQFVLLSKTEHLFGPKQSLKEKESYVLVLINLVFSDNIKTLPLYLKLAVSA
jgi:hypothetical protein